MTKYNRPTRCPNWMQRMVRLFCRVWNSPYANNWRAINTAPKDGTEIIVYCPPAYGLPHMVSVCAWHPDAGFCVCQLREPTLWSHLPNIEVRNVRFASVPHN